MNSGICSTTVFMRNIIFSISSSGKQNCSRSVGDKRVCRNIIGQYPRLSRSARPTEYSSPLRLYNRLRLFSPPLQHLLCTSNHCHLLLPQAWLIRFADARDPLCKSLLSPTLTYPTLTSSSSCTLCRKRKIRCNRETPCGNCIRSKIGSCVYETDVLPDQRLGAKPPAPIQPRREGLGAPLTTNAEPGLAFATPNNTLSNRSAFELDSLRARINELEDKLSRATSTASSASPTAATPTSTHTVQTISTIACTVNVLEDSRMPGGATISRGVAHKNRVFGQTHWMNGFIMAGPPSELS